VETNSFEFGAVGGIRCVFHFGQQGFIDSGEVLLDLVPQELAGPGELVASLAPQTCDPGTNGLWITNAGCSATASVAGWWYRLKVFTFRSPQDQQANFEAVTVMLEQALKGAAVPTLKHAEMAVEPFDCQAVDTGGLSVTSSRVVVYQGEGPIPAAVVRSIALVDCVFTTADGVEWSVNAYPSSLPPYDQCTHGL